MEGTKFKLISNYYSYIELTSTYADSNFIYLKASYDDGANYKLEIKTQKLRKWNGYEWNIVNEELKAWDSEDNYYDVWLNGEKYLGD